jgi:amino acid adenylation domain-containing protein
VIRLDVQPEAPALLAPRTETVLPESPAPAHSVAARIVGALDLDALAESWAAVLQAHPSLRLRPRADGEAGAGRWSPHKMPMQVRSAAAGAGLADIAERRFDVTGEPLTELDVLRLAADEHVLSVVSHPLAADRASVRLVLADLLRHLDGGVLIRSEEPAVTGLRSTAVTGPRSATPERPAAAEPPLGVGTRPDVPLGPGARVVVDLDHDIRQISDAQGAAPLSVLGTAVAETLRRYNDAETATIGSPVDRRSPATAHAVGAFARTVPVVLRTEHARPVREAVAATHRALLLARSAASQDAEGARVVVAHEIVGELPQPAGLRAGWTDLPAGTVRTDIAVVLQESGEQARLEVTYRADRYDAELITRFTRHLGRILAGIGEAGAGTLIGELAVLDDAEIAELLAAGRGEDLGDDRTTVPETVAAIAARHPDRVAVTCAGQRLTYRELDVWAGQIAGRLAAAGVARGDRVGVLTDRSAAMVAAVLGATYAGACYVPVDPAHPDSRIAAVLADARVDAVLVTGDLGGRLTGTTAPVLPVDDIPADRPPAGRVPVEPGDPAYLIYTSGSTGEPKGVLVDHGNLAVSTLARRRTYPSTPVFLHVSPLVFDSSVAGLWGTLTTGGQLLIAGAEDARDPERLIELAARGQVTHLLCVPSLHEVLLTVLSRPGSPALPSLREVVVAGEALSEPLLAQHFAVLPGVSLVNEYGPTEATVWATFRRYDAPGPVDIGGPIPGARLYVLDERGALLPQGASGELYIGGPGVARGYLGREPETAAAFRPDPFAEEPGARMYRTGDRVRWSTENTLQFIGRRDSQVKVRGYRVELGAVEAALRTCAGVRDVVVVVDRSNGPLQLVAVVAGARGTDPQRVRQEAAAILPEPMVPARVHFVDKLPTLVNGKVDRGTAADLATVAPATPAPVPAPAADSELTGQVQALWSELLAVPSVPTDVNFFDLGGHSLMMIKLQAGFAVRLRQEVRIVDLFRHTTVAQQVALLRGEGKDTAGTAPATDRRSLVARARLRRVQGQDAR